MGKKSRQPKKRILTKEERAKEKRKQNFKVSYFPVLDKDGQETGFSVDPYGKCIIDENQSIVAQTKDGSRVGNTNFNVEASFENSDVSASARCYMLYKCYRKAYSDYSSGLEG